MFKRAVRGVAARHGCIACFMAKPFAERAGAGMHLHASLADRRRPQRLRGRGARRDRRCCVTRSAACAQTLGGRHGGVRAARQFLSPLPRDELRAGGRDLGRQQPHGQPARAGGPAARAATSSTASPGADANPYLVAAVVLAGMLRGIEREHRSGPAGRGQRLRAGGATGGLPTQWHAALERAARSEFLADALGAEFLGVFLALKRRECEKFGALVTDRDYEWYLDTRLSRRDITARRAARGCALSQVDGLFCES